MRKVFLENLPKWENSTHKGKINWRKSIGCDVNFIYDNLKGKIKIINCNNQYLDIEYNGNIINIAITNFRECYIGSLLKLKFHNINYKYNIGEIIIIKTGKIKILKQIKIKLGKYTYDRKAYEYECLSCNNKDIILEKNINRYGCNLCNNIKIIKGYNDLWATHPNIAKLLKYPDRGHKITYGSKRKEIFICPDCGLEKQIHVYRIINRRFSCPRCGDGFSYPNKFAFNLLIQANINFIPEYSPQWIKPKRYDFYFEINNKKYILEMDGGLGHGNKSYKKNLKEDIENDKYKEYMAKLHDIHIIRIDSKLSELEYIKNNLINKLNNIINLSQINWFKCHEYALNNLMKMVWNLWNQEINIMTICKTLKINRMTCTRYLKQGNKIGTCKYNSDHLNKKVICLNTHEIFDSISNAKNKYGKGIKIGECCMNKRSSAGKHPETKEPLRWAYYNEDSHDMASASQI